MHVPFGRQEDPFIRHASPHQRPDREPHHDLGPDHERGRGRRVERRRADEVGHHPDVAAPVTGGRVHGDLDVQVEPAAPGGQLFRVQQVGRGARAVEQHDPPVAVPVREQVVEGGPHRRHPDAAGHDHHIAALGLGHRPVRPVGPAYADLLARLPRAQRVRDRAHVADRVPDRAGRFGIAADRDRHLADPEGVQHVELARLEGERAAGRLKLQRDRVVRFPPRGGHPPRLPVKPRLLGPSGLSAGLHERSRIRRGAGAWWTGAGRSPGWRSGA